MHIKYERVDRDETTAFEDALAQLVNLRRIRANLAIYRYRVPVYRLLLSDVEKNKPELPAQPAAWRYFAGGKSQEHTVSGDVNLDAKHPVSNLTYGVAAFRTFTNLTELASLDSTDTGTYSPQYLQIPGLLVEAFRLEPVLAPGERGQAAVVPYHALAGDFEGGSGTLTRRFAIKSRRHYANCLWATTALRISKPTLLPRCERTPHVGRGVGDKVSVVFTRREASVSAGSEYAN